MNGCDAGGAKGPLGDLGVDEVVVVAENAPRTQRRRDPRESLCEELGIGLAAVHLVAGEEDHVRRQPQGELADAFHAIDAHIGPGVNIGDLEDAQPVPLAGKGWQGQGLTTDSRPVERTGETVSGETECPGGGEGGIFYEASSGEQTRVPPATAVARAPRIVHPL